VAGSREHSSEISCSVKYGEILDWLKNSQHFKKDCAAWSWHEIYAQVNTAYSCTPFPTLFVVWKLITGINFWNAY
jgi:hypothetical protein